MILRKNTKIILSVSLLLSLSLMTGCVDQRMSEKVADAISKSTAVVDNTKDWPETTKRIVATSPATVHIFEKLKVDLVGVPQTSVDQIPQVYKNATVVGSSMNPDIEIIRSLEPTYVFSPISLMPDLKPKYDQANVNYGFINLNNVQGMYASISDLGKLLGREKEAEALVQDYKKFMDDFEGRNKNKKKQKVLILMGLPGSYVVATEYSYAGSLVKLAGAENVYKSENREQFVNVNIEDMLKKEPDIILRTAHAMPEDVKKMFAEEFRTNNNWKHFKAVKENKVYDLDHSKFGMSAKFNYKEALVDLEEIFYGKN